MSHVPHLDNYRKNKGGTAYETALQGNHWNSTLGSGSDSGVEVFQEIVMEGNLVVLDNRLDHRSRTLLGGGEMITWICKNRGMLFMLLCLLVFLGCAIYMGLPS